MSRAPAVVLDVQNKYMDRMLLTRVRRTSILVGHMLADVAVAAALTLPILAFGLVLGVRFDAAVNSSFMLFFGRAGQDHAGDRPRWGLEHVHVLRRPSRSSQPELKAEGLGVALLTIGGLSVRNESRKAQPLLEFLARDTVSSAEAMIDWTIERPSPGPPVFRERDVSLPPR